jgi:hypothetical protein
MTFLPLFFLGFIQAIGCLGVVGFEKAEGGDLHGEEEGLPADDRTAVDGCVDFNLLEEEFQMQMALAISASDPLPQGYGRRPMVSLAATRRTPWSTILPLC